MTGGVLYRLWCWFFGEPAPPCQHQWRLTQDTVTESRVEHLRRLGFDVTSIGSYHVNDMTRRLHTTTHVCDKCGAIHQTRTWI